MIWEEAPLLASQISNQYDLTAIDIKTANAQFETGTQIRNIITYAVSNYIACGGRFWHL
jgi:lipoprotein-releasing system permease protein